MWAVVAVVSAFLVRVPAELEECLHPWTHTVAEVALVEHPAEQVLSLNPTVARVDYTVVAVAATHLLLAEAGAEVFVM